MSRTRSSCVYILASDRHGTLYIGVTSDLIARLHQHRTGATPVLTTRYGVKRLVRFEMADPIRGDRARSSSRIGGARGRST